ncbi:MAG: hypothetical protein JKY94_16665 [Rhodobacteraceae bacterium]|nr:hypothetical protein [Paracoccaceae bacterium]
MSVLPGGMPPKMRRPVGILMGGIGVGKTTQLVRAFHQWGFLKSDPTALEAPVDMILSGDTETMGDAKVPTVTYDLIDDGKTPWLAYLEIFYKWVDRRMEVQKDQWLKMSPEQRKKNRHLRFRLQGKSGKLGLDIPSPGLPGFVITDASSLWHSTMISAKDTEGSGWDTNDKVVAVLNKLIATFYKWNLGLVLDGHIAEASEEKNYPRGYDWPLGSMRTSVAKPLAFIWELVYVSPEDDGIGATRHILTQPGYSPDNPLGTIRKTRRKGLPAKLDLEEKSMAEYLQDVHFRLD